LDWGWQRIGAKKGEVTGVTLCYTATIFFMDMGDLQSFLLNACPDIPKHMGKAFCLLYVMFNILGLSSHPRFCRLFNWPRKTAEDSRNTKGNSCVKVSIILKINMFDHVCPFWDTFIFGACLVYGYGSIPINTIFRGLFTSINQLF